MDVETPPIQRAYDHIVSAISILEGYDHDALPLLDHALTLVAEPLEIKPRTAPAEQLML